MFGKVSFSGAVFSFQRVLSNSMLLAKKSYKLKAYFSWVIEGVRGFVLESVAMDLAWGEMWVGLVVEWVWVVLDLSRNKTALLVLMMLCHIYIILCHCPTISAAWICMIIWIVVCGSSFRDRLFVVIENAGTFLVSLEALMRNGDLLLHLLGRLLHTLLFNHHCKLMIIHGYWRIFLLFVVVFILLKTFNI